MAFLQDEESNEYSIPIFIGFNQAVNEQLLKPGETQNAQNFIVDDGALTVANGYSKYKDVPFPDKIKTLIAFYKNNSDGSITSYLLASNDTTLYKFNTATNAWDSIKTGLTNGYLDYINYQNGMTPLVIMGNGEISPFTYDGTTVANLGGTPPKFKSVTLHYERVWAIGVKAYPDTVYFSKDQEPTNWNTALGSQDEVQGGEIDVKTWDGGKLIGITNIFDDVVVFKTNSIHRISGVYPDEYALLNVFSSTGAIAERSIVNAVNQVFFLSKDGIYSYNGTSAQCISESIKDIIATMNPSYRDKAAAVFFKNKYILAIPTGSSTVNDTVIEYDVVRQNFIVKKGLQVNTFLPYDDKLLFGNDNLINGNSYVYQYNTGLNNDGASIDAFWETPETDLALPNAKKTVNEFYATVKGTGTMKVEAICDGVSKSVDITLNYTVPTVIKTRIRNKGRRIKFKFSNVNGSQFKLINPKFMLDIDMD